MKKICLAALITFVLTVALMSTVQAQTPQETLTQYISDLQRNPNDYTLREKIIKHVQTMKPAPAVPDEVAKHEGAAEYAFKNAKNESDYLDSANEYEKALLIAPWLAADYFNCGVAYEKAGKFKNAVTSFNFYIMAAPDAKDAGAVRKRIGGLEYAAEKAAKEAQDATEKAAREEQQRDAPKILLNQLKSQYEGATYSWTSCSHLPQNGCFQEAGVFPCGCNETEKNGASWYEDSDRNVYISFAADGTILFFETMNRLGTWPLLKGTPKGPRIEDIVWEFNEGYSSNIAWKPVWTKKLDSGLGRIIFSHGGVTGKFTRPSDDALYSPYERYDYTILKKK